MRLAHVAAFLLMLGILICIHELGHFIAARLIGVKVLKFSIGFPPTLFRRKRGETEYTLGLIPFGGYVRVLGPAPEYMKRIQGFDRSMSLASKSAKAQACFFAAGPLANYLFALMLICGAYVLGPPGSAPVIGTVLEDSPAKSAGFLTGDRITAVNNTEIDRWNDLVNIIRAHPGDRLEMSVNRNGKRITLSVTPVVKSQDSALTQSVPHIGIKASTNYEHRLGLIHSLKEGFIATAKLTWGILSTIKSLVTGNVQSADIGGPVSIYQQSNQYFESGIFGFFFYMAFISINLAFFNMLPVPILDGGHLVFLLIQSGHRPTRQNGSQARGHVGGIRFYTYRYTADLPQRSDAHGRSQRHVTPPVRLSA